VRKVLLEWRGLKLYAYPVMLFTGALMGIVVGTRVAQGMGLNPGRVYSGMVLLFPAALVGARMLFILSHWRFYGRELDRLWRQSEGGASLYGGLILSFLVSVPMLTILGLPFWAFWDAGSTTMLIGMMFTKVGCLLNGCCAGRPSQGWLSWYLPDRRGVWRRRWPAQLLEAGWAGAILLILVLLWDRMPFSGERFLGALAAYSLGRIWLESIREEVETIGPFGLHQAISVALLAACLTSYWLMWPRTP
jgi:prolipoprotein diacylglyceryltransferase